MSKWKNKYVELPVQVRASLWFLICSFMQKGVSMISTPIFTRLLETKEYGQYNVFNSWLGVLTIFVSMSLAGGVYTQGLIKFEEDRNRFSSSLQGLSTILVFVWTVIYIAAHDFWNSVLSLTTVQMLAMLIMIWSTAVFNFWSNEQRVIYKYKNLVIITLIVSFVQPIIGIVFVVLSDDKVTARILGLALVELVSWFGLYVAQMKRGKCFYNSKYWFYAIKFNLPLIPHYLSQTVLSGADRIMISMIIGDDEAGIYSLAYSLSMIMALFNVALMQTLSPWIYQKIKARRIKDIEPIAYFSLIIVAAVNLILILFAPEAVAIFAPKAYYDAIWIVPPVAMSVFFLYSYDLFAKFAFYFEKTRLIMIASIIGAALNVLLNYIFIRKFGYVAAGYTTLFCYIVYSYAHYLLMNHICEKMCNGERPYNSKKILLITVSFLWIGFFLLLTYNYPTVRYILIILAVVIIIIKRDKIKDIIKKIVKLRKQ